MQLDGNLRVFFGRGIPRFIGTGIILKNAEKLRFLFGRHPAFQKHGGFSPEKIFLRFRDRDFRAHLVGSKPHIVSPDVFRLDRLSQPFLLRGKLLKRHFRFPGALTRRTVHTAYRRGRVAERSERIQHFAELFPQADQKAVMLCPVAAHFDQLRFIRDRGNCAADLFKRYAGRNGAKLDRRILGALAVERHRQLHPGLQTLDHGTLAAFLRCNSFERGIVLLDLAGKLHGSPHARLIQKCIRFHFGLRREERRLLRNIAVEQLQAVQQRSMRLFEGHQICILAFYQICDLGGTDFVPDLGDFHTTVTDQVLKESVLLVTDHGERQPFHL